MYCNCLCVRNNNNNNKKTKKLRALAGGGVGGVGPLPPLSEKIIRNTHFQVKGVFDGKKFNLYAIIGENFIAIRQG